MDTHGARAFWDAADRPELELAEAPAPAALKVRVRGRAPEVRRVTFSSTLYRGRAVRIFGYAALQEDPAAHPTAVLVHGGAALAEALLGGRLPQYWPMGFNVLSIDLPGRGEQRDRSRSSGPDMVHGNLFWRGPDLRDGWLYHAVQAVRRTIDAAERLGCDPRRVMLDGWSWGGVISLLAAAAEPRVSHVSAVYGAGELVHGALGRDVAAMGPDAAERWRDAFDPIRQAYREGQTFYLLTATNDQYFALSDHLRTWRGLGAGRAHWAAVPNLNHHLTTEGIASLDAVGAAFAAGRAPAWSEPGEPRSAGDGLEVPLAGRAQRVELLSADAAAARDQRWTELAWDAAPLAVADGRARIAAERVDGRAWFVQALSEAGLLAAGELHDGLGGPLEG